MREDGKYEKIKFKAKSHKSAYREISLTPSVENKKNIKIKPNVVDAVLAEKEILFNDNQTSHRVLWMKHAGGADDRQRLIFFTRKNGDMELKVVGEYLLIECDYDEILFEIPEIDKIFQVMIHIWFNWYYPEINHPSNENFKFIYVN